MITLLMAVWGVATIAATGLCVKALLRSAPPRQGRRSENDWFFEGRQQ